MKECDNFSYTDPIDQSVSKNQGLYVRFEDGSRIVFRLSGTGSAGATVRLYVEKYSQDQAEFGGDTQEGLKPLIEVALAVSKLQQFLKVEKPTVITVSYIYIMSSSIRTVMMLSRQTVMRWKREIRQNQRRINDLLQNDIAHDHPLPKGSVCNAPIQVP